jgi:pyridoxine 5-phosphate synthase
VELHTGAYCDLHYEKRYEDREAELSRLKDMASLAHSLGLEVHAGHGLTYDTVTPIAELPEIVELNIGHFLIGESIFTGLKDTILKMRDLMDKARSK